MREILLAGQAVKKYGDGLTGREIVTVKVGAWPGGRARVLELYSDPAAPEIVLQVKAVENNTRVTRAILSQQLDSDEIGIFENEEIILLDPPLLTEEESQLVIGAIPLRALPE